MSPQEIIQKFLQRQVGVVYGTEIVSRFELYHVGSEGSERVQVFPFVPSETRVDELAAEIFDIAENDAQSRQSSTPERYGLSGFIESDANGVGQVSFSFEAKSSRFSDFESSEGPSQRGQTSQLMRHTERMHQMMCQMTEVTLGRLMQENVSLRLELDKHLKREDETRQAYNAAMDLKDEREIKNAEALMVAKRKDQMGGMLLSMAPAILSQVLGGKGMKGPASTATEIAVKQFMGELTQEEISGVLKALSPSHQMALLEVYKTLRTESKQADEGKPRILRASEDAA